MNAPMTPAAAEAQLGAEAAKTEVAINWKHSDSWRMRGRDFMVEVYHYTEQVREATSWYGDGEGPHRWNVYTYIYPTHPHFARFLRDGAMFQDAATTLPFHAGPSFLEFPQYDDKVTCAKVGSDYHHLHDDHYTHMENREQAGEIFEDAERLFAYLNSMADAAKATGEAQ